MNEKLIAYMLIAFSLIHVTYNDLGTAKYIHYAFSDGNSVKFLVLM